VIPRSALELPLVKADPHLAAYFEAKAEALVRRGQVETALPLSAQVRRRIIEALPSGPPALPARGAALGQSPRSLRRHLAGEGTSFHQLVEQIRSELARQHLEDAGLTVSEIAFLVGFFRTEPVPAGFPALDGRDSGGIPPSPEGFGAVRAFRSLQSRPREIDNDPHTGEPTTAERRRHSAARPHEPEPGNAGGGRPDGREHERQGGRAVGI
jgi:AraC-like DNA-binding protein